MNLTAQHLNNAIEHLQNANTSIRGAIAADRAEGEQRADELIRLLRIAEGLTATVAKSHELPLTPAQIEQRILVENALDRCG